MGGEMNPVYLAIGLVQACADVRTCSRRLDTLTSRDDLFGRLMAAATPLRDAGRSTIALAMASLGRN